MQHKERKFRLLSPSIIASALLFPWTVSLIAWSLWADIGLFLICNFIFWLLALSLILSWSNFLLLRNITVRLRSGEKEES